MTEKQLKRHPPIYNSERFMSDVVSTIENLEKQRREDHVQAMLWHEVGIVFFW
jgi:hypothetical protein